MKDRVLTAEETKPNAMRGIDSAVSDDFAFFRQNTHRRYRLRQASPAEQFEAALAGMRAADGEGLFVIYRFLFEGGTPPIDAHIAVRAFIRLPLDTETAIPDHRVKRLYDDLITKRPHLARDDAVLVDLAERAMQAAELQRLAGLDEEESPDDRPN